MNYTNLPPLDISGLDVTTKVDQPTNSTHALANVNASVIGCLAVDVNAFSSVLRTQDEAFSMQVNQLFQEIRGTVLLPILFFLGVPGNVLNLVVFCKQGLGQRINLCLFTLALLDLVYLVFVFFFYADRLASGALGQRGVLLADMGPFEKFFVQNHLFWFYGLAWAAMFVSAVISSERAKTLLRTRTMAAILLLGVAAITMGVFGVTEKYGVGCFYDVDTGHTVLHMTDTAYYVSNRELVDFLDGVLYGCIIPGICFLVVSLTTAISAVQLSASSKWRQISSLSTAAMSPPEVTLTKMLIVLSALFIVLNLPNVTFRLSLFFVPELKYSGQLGNLFVFLVGWAELCAAVNASSSIVVYWLAGSRYRGTVRELGMLLAGLYRPKAPVPRRRWPAEPRTPSDQRG